MTALVRGLARRHAVHLLAPHSDRWLLADGRQAGAAVVPLRGTSERARSESLRAWLRTSQVDLLHVHGGVSSEGVRAVLVAADLGVPLVRTEHQPLRSPSTTGRAPYLEVAARARRVVCVSAGVARSFEAGGVPHDVLTVVRNGVPEPPASTPKAAVLAGLGLPPASRVLLTVGRLDAQKGYPDLLQAAGVVVRQCADVHLVWVGSGPQERELRDGVGAAGLLGRVHLLGQRDDVHDLLSASYALVSPSLYEGLPLVVLEAIASGVPVVGTQVTGTEEAVVDGLTGRLVPAATPPALTHALLELLADPGLAAGWGANGRRRYEAEFTAERMVRETVGVYEQALGRRPAAGPRGMSQRQGG